MLTPWVHTHNISEQASMLGPFVCQQRMSSSDSALVISQCTDCKLNLTWFIPVVDSHWNTTRKLNLTWFSPVVDSHWNTTRKLNLTWFSPVVDSHWNTTRKLNLTWFSPVVDSHWNTTLLGLVKLLGASWKLPYRVLLTVVVPSSQCKASVL